MLTAANTSGTCRLLLMCIGNAAKPEALKILPRMPYQCITELKMCMSVSGAVFRMVNTFQLSDGAIKVEVLPANVIRLICETYMMIIYWCEQSEEVRWIEAGDAENELTEVHIVQTVQDSSRASVADADLEPAVDRVTAEEAFIGF
ncbi:hypothetical protein J6590_093085 [Homalodisca vitripennis]|nr:hypothetical protein J6590_093085 [Homalodisca vitripennis]